MNSSAIYVAIAVAVGIVLLTALSVWSRRHALKALKNWAHSRDLELVSAKRRSFVPLWTSGKGYQFFRIVVRGRDGEISKAWVRCFDFNAAEPANLEVTWDN